VISFYWLKQNKKWRGAKAVAAHPGDENGRQRNQHDRMAR
jgi:hypothetical protein